MMIAPKGRTIAKSPVPTSDPCAYQSLITDTGATGRAANFNIRRGTTAPYTTPFAKYAAINPTEFTHFCSAISRAADVVTEKIVENVRI